MQMSKDNVIKDPTFNLLYFTHTHTHQKEIENKWEGFFAMDSTNVKTLTCPADGKLDSTIPNTLVESTVSIIRSRMF